MGHSQFAELIGARGPNTQINSACASTTQAVALAEDWIRAGRCRRVVVVAADDASSDELLPWIGAGFLATGAAATDERVEDAALPFDRRRHGMLIGMGAAGIVVEAAEAARERGITRSARCSARPPPTARSTGPGSTSSTSARSWRTWSPRPRRAGSPVTPSRPRRCSSPTRPTPPPAGAAPRRRSTRCGRSSVPGADRIVIANTKGVTGHPMGVGVEDIVAIKALETGIVPPVPNFREIDPELGQLNLSQGGSYPVKYALRLAAGFGSQISMMLLRWTPVADGQRRAPDDLGFAYRVTDPGAWHAWIERITGRPGAELEVVHRWLRVVDTGPAARPASPAATPVTIPAAAPAAVAAPAAPPWRQRRSRRYRRATRWRRVLQLVAEQTGYPSDMLDLELDLEADLGIDTVKQAELFVAVREMFDIERDDSLQLRDYPSLSHVIGFVRDRAPAHKLAALAPAPTPAVAPAAVAEVPAGDPLEAAVLQLVADQTGYPSDMLDLELDLEADLGIDTVKQAELFVAVREMFDIDRDDSLQLRDYPSLSHVIGFVRDRAPADKLAALAPAPAPAAVAASPGVATAPAPVVTDPVEAAILELVAEQTGYPPDMLDLELDLEADLGVDTVKQAELFVAVRERFDIERDDSLQLRDYPTLGHVIGFVRDRAPADKLAALAPVPAPAPAPGDGRSCRDRASPRADRGHRSGRGGDPRARVGADGLSAGHAGPGARPGGGPRDRHGQAGGAVRRRA
jgi:acyl carrier protein